METSCQHLASLIFVIDDPFVDDESLDSGIAALNLKRTTWKAI
jgi:hypothetical protein